ncbi:MAG: tellurite resistance TerB family protein [Myxococcaceae bacterium]|nr:tellurite resistance TerB family protein [Myxococcaceae bacterium]
MLPEKARQTRVDRNTALIEAMLLAASADGDLSQIELQALLRRVVERPEFEGTKPGDLKAQIELAALSLSKAKKLDDVLASLRARLPDHRNRLLAFGLAAAVAFSDRRASREELGLLKTFQAALGVSENEVAEIISVIEAGGSLAESLGEPLERLYAEVMVWVSLADGDLSGSELEALLESLAGDPVFLDVSPQKAQQYLREAAQALATEGLSQRLVVLAHGLTTHTQRVKAYSLAARVGLSRRGRRPSEDKVLEILQATLGLADDEVARIHQESV